MKALRFAAVVAVAVVAGVLAVSAPAQANVTQPFRADSGDRCRYGTAEGYLTWRYNPAAPTRLVMLDVRGTLADRPVANDPGFACRDDGYLSVVTFTVSMADGSVSRRDARLDNQSASVAFTVGSNSVSVARLVVQVCRYPLFSTPPATGYCGMSQTYPSPI